MAIRRYVVVGESGEIEGEPSLSRKFSFGTLTPPAVNIRELSEDAAAQEAAKFDVTAVVPGIPMRLLEPDSVEPTADLLPDGAAWGLHAVGALDTPFSGSGIKVAVLDTGIDRTHECFRGVNLEERDYTGEGNGDVNGHGTHCAATIFGRDVRGARVGVARGVTHAFIGKVIGRNGCDSSILLKAIWDAAAAGCQVISMSLGFDFPKLAMTIKSDGLPSELATAKALHEYRANLRLFDHLGAFLRDRTLSRLPEVLLIAAAGNESKRRRTPPYDMPATPPSEAEGFIAVGALGLLPDKQLVVAPFSNAGCMISAPGVAIVSARAGTTVDFRALSGTSMAVPHVAGIAAMFTEKAAAEHKDGPWRDRGPSILDRLLHGASTKLLNKSASRADVGFGLARAPTTEALD